MEDKAEHKTQPLFKGPLETRIDQGPLIARIQKARSASPMGRKTTPDPLLDRPLKKPRLCSRMSDDGISPLTSPSGVFTPSSTSMETTTIPNEVNESAALTTSWTRSKKRRESKKRQRARERESNLRCSIDPALLYRPGQRNSCSRSPHSNRDGTKGGSEERNRWSSPNGDVDPAISGGKRVRIRREQLPWATRDDEFSSNITDSSCLRNQELLRLFKLDISFTLSDIELSPSAPLGFPESEWRKIIEGHTVNLNTVLGHLHFREAPEPSHGRLGDKELILPAPKGATRVTDAGQWASAWDAASEAYEFIFEHCRQELREYGSRIRRLFAARLPQSASRIIDYDDAVRKYVKGGTAMRLTDSHHYDHLFDAFLSFDGIESQRRESTKKGKGGNYGGGGSGGGRAAGICDRYNDKGGCERADGKCRFRHVCNGCGNGGHGQSSCKGGGGKAS
ncbi:hypothetical protein D9611_009603 [Ephemerocybe angulata]|uniref:C3H1-type domain-containing protein n=1 Tax=Ephemerocybe angulata TaxID=980116 RepID=A0A8H5C5W1_9AGAR|nr:hypothetical protein D9611_009603 [Tulosesus angulatus]